MSNQQIQVRDQVTKLQNSLSAKADYIRDQLPAHIDTKRFSAVIVTTALNNPMLFNCDKASLITAAAKLAHQGCMPDGREAALVPFKTRVNEGGQWRDKWIVTPIVMTAGWKKLVRQSGEILSLETGVIYRAEIENGSFIYEIGIEPPIRHRPSFDLTDEQCHDDNIVGAYSIAKLKNPFGGDPYYSVEVMRRAEINKVRQSSQTGALGRTDRSGKPIPPKGPWVDWFSEMCRKTVFRRHAKSLPLSTDLVMAVAEEMDNEKANEAAAAVLEADFAEQPKQARLPDGEAYDPTTGELDGRGMTEVDEETARRLDAGESTEDKPETVTDPAPVEEKKKRAPRKTAEQKYAEAAAAAAASEAEKEKPDWIASPSGWFDQPAEESTTDTADETPSWQKWQDDFYTQLDAAKNQQDWEACEKSFAMNVEALPQENGNAIRQALANTRKRIIAAMNAANAD